MWTLQTTNSAFGQKKDWFSRFSVRQSFYPSHLLIILNDQMAQRCNVKIFLYISVSKLNSLHLESYALKQITFKFNLSIKMSLRQDGSISKNLDKIIWQNWEWKNHFILFLVRKSYCLNRKPDLRCPLLFFWAAIPLWAELLSRYIG